MLVLEPETVGAEDESEVVGLIRDEGVAGGVQLAPFVWVDVVFLGWWGGGGRRCADVLLEVLLEGGDEGGGGVVCYCDLSPLSVSLCTRRLLR